MNDPNRSFRVGVLRAGDLGAEGCFCSLPRALAGGDLKEGTIASVVTEGGRTALARLRVHDDGPDALLDRSLRLTLRLRVGDRIQVRPAEMQPVSEAIFVPAADLSRMLMEGVEFTLKKALVAGRTPLSPGLVLYLRLSSSTAGTFFKLMELTGGPGLATDETVVRVTYSTEAQFTEISQGVSYADVGGLQLQLATVRELVELPLLHPYLFRRVGINPPKGLIFHGPPGTGKTHVARAIAGELNARFFYINGADVAGRIGVEAENALRGTFAEATHHAPAIIFIDEVDALAPQRGETGMHSDTKLVSQLLTLLDGLQRMDGVTVIGTTNRINSLDTALRRPGRFEREILFTVPAAADRLTILDIHSREMPLTREAMEFLPELASLTAGYTGADLMELCREAALNAIRRAMPVGDPRTVDSATIEVHVLPGDFRKGLHEIRPSALRELLVERPTVRWQDIGGLSAVKDRLKEILGLRMRRPDLLKALRLSPTVGILLHGPSGSGKTMLAKAAANEFGLHFLWIRGPEVFSKWMGESEQSVRRIFTVARQVAPCLVFFDQLEAIAPRQMAETGASAPQRVLHQLVSELDDLDRDEGLVVMGAAASIDLLDPSVIRSGRFGQHLEVPLPDEADRESILELLLMPAEPWLDDELRELVKRLASTTKGLSGADLRSVCDEAKHIAATRAQDRHDPRITWADFESAISRVAGRSPR